MKTPRYILNTTILLIMAIFSFYVVIFSIHDAKIQEETLEKENQEKYEQVLYELKCIEALEAMENISNITDREEYFIEYLNIVNEYSEYVDAPESLSDYYSEDELELFYRVVAAEVDDSYSFDTKARVATVILNRIDNENFGDSFKDILTDDQFETVLNNRYKKVEVTSKTVLACEYAFQFGCEEVSDCLFFDSNNALNYTLAYKDNTFNYYTLKEDK